MLGQPIEPDAGAKQRWAAQLAAQYGEMSEDQRQAIAQMPENWQRLRTVWPALTNAQRAKRRADWKAQLGPALARAAQSKRTATAPATIVACLVNTSYADHLATLASLHTMLGAHCSWNSRCSPSSTISAITARMSYGRLGSAGTRSSSASFKRIAGSPVGEQVWSSRCSTNWKS